jgi:hypothetical protein
MAEQEEPTANPNEECLGCVVGAVEAWAGIQVTDLGSVLADLYLPNHGVCERGALRMLADSLNAGPCGREVNVDDLSCTFTVARLIREACGEVV